MNLTNNIVIHKEENGLNYLQFRILNEFPEIFHCFTLKPDDFATVDGYESNKAKAQQAEARYAELFGVDTNRLVRPRQTHTDIVKYAGYDDAGIFPPQLDDVDGLMTDLSGLPLMLTFADCTPLFFYDPEKHVVANTHSGWQGTLKRIGEKTVTAMKEKFDCDPSDIICCIGPHIRKECFQVDEDVKQAFAEEFSDIKEIDKLITFNEDEEKYYIDTLGININMLLKAGLKEENIYDSGICTVCSHDICHSYRAEKELSGRSASMISLVSQTS